ncbi:MAG: efflux RND transporter permease subunit [Synergistaceae bacterium]|jgi:HAE1 family hydrophobic/amphiphilic exporter-1|nr:efflux RND transporter permease subunit [Synergistaceae bacterium]
MKIIDTSLKRPVTVLILTIAVLIVGFYSYANMGVERMPNIDFPIVVVRTTMEGAAPAIMDNDVTDVLEARINTIEGIKNISSSSYEGRSVIVIEFDLDRNIDFAAADVRGKVSMARGRLPDDCEEPQIDKYDPSDRPIINIAVESDGRTDMRSVARYVDNVVSERLQTVTGVGSVQLAGFRDREIRVWLNTDSMEAYGVTTKDIKTAIYNRHVELPAGRIETGTREYGIRLNGEYRSVSELASVPVTFRNGAIIRLNDLARIEDDFEDRRSQSLYENKPTIMVQVRKQKGANEVALSRGVRQRLEELNKIAPRGTKLVIVSDTSRFILRSMNGVRGDIILAICLTSIIMFVFLRTLRATIIAVITIPVCLLGSIAVLYWMGITINNISMMGLSLAVGMVVDATSVVMENISRHKAMGKTTMRAAREGAGEVGFAVIAGAATTLAVFLPIAFMGGMMGKIFNAFGITVAMTISISLLLSLTLTPFLCSRILSRERQGLLQRILEAPFILLERGYKIALASAIRHRYTTVLIALAVFMGGLFLATKLGSEFQPTEDQGFLRLNMELPAETALEVTERVMGEMIKVIEEEPSVAYTYGVAGSGQGEEVYKGTLTIELIPRDQRPPSSVIMSTLRRKLAAFRDVDIKMGNWGGSDLTLVVRGPTSEALAEIGDRIKADLAKNPRGLVDIMTDLQMNKPRINLELNRALADDLGVNIRDLSDELDAWFGGDDSGSTFSEGGYRYNIKIRAENNLRDDPNRVFNTLVRTEGGKVIRAEGLVTSSIGVSPNVIKRYNRQRSIQISANVEGISPGEGITIMEDEFRKFAPQDGTYDMVPTGDSERMKDTFSAMTIALVFAILLVYIVMAIQFESFLHPFTVMFSLPLMTAGSFGLMYLFRLRISVMSFMGIILLVGVVVNNAILLVDFINQLRAGGMKKLDAVLASGPLRLRAILMTTVSTIVGNLPVALALSEGGEMRQPMSVAVTGGLFTSTLLTLFVIPVVYLIFDDMKDRVVARIRRFNAWRRLREQRSRKNPDAGSSEIGTSAAIFLMTGILLLTPLSPAEADTKTPLNIREAVELTLARNSTLLSLREEALKAYAFKLQADGTMTPQVSISGSANLQKETQTSDGSDRKDSRAVTAALSQTLYSGGRNSALRRQSSQVRSIAELNLADAENRAIGELFARFYNVLLQERRVETERSAIVAGELHLREVTRMNELGLSNRLEVIRASQQLAASRADFASAEGLRDAAQISLMNFLAVPPEERRPVDGKLAPMEISGNRQESLAAAMSNRADLAALKQQIEYQSNQIEIERSALRPQLGLTASTGLSDPYNREDRGGDTWRADLTLTLPIFDRGVSRGNVIKAQAVMKQNEIARAQKELDVKSETETAWTELETARENLESTAQALELAEETLRLAEVGFQEGVTPQLDLLSAQTSLTESRLEHLRSLYNNLLAIVALKVTEGNIADWVEGMTF